jgi:hypothetical protein
MAIKIGAIRYTPDPMVAGGKVKATCEVLADDGVESVKLYDPEYRVLHAKDAGDGTYTLEENVPYDAPPGTYYVTLVVTDKAGNTERKSIPIKIGR